MPISKRAEDGRHDQQGGAGILAAGFLESGDAVRDGLNPGDRSGAVGKGAQDQEHAEGLERAAR